MLAVVLYGLWRGGWLDALLSGIALGMSMLPEELPLVLTVFMVMGAWRNSRARVLTRRATPGSVDIEDLQSSRAQPLTHRADKTLHQLVAEIVIGFAFVARTARTDPQHAYELHSPRIERPAIGRHQPRRVENVALAQQAWCRAYALNLDSSEPALRLSRDQLPSPRHTFRDRKDALRSLQY